MGEYTAIEAWGAVGLAFLGTFIWRFMGVVLADRIAADSLLMQWVNAAAYSMVAGVMMLVLVFPTGILSTTQLDHRLAGFGVGVLVLLLARKLWLGLFAAIASFAIAVGFF